jgi:hypothetical protein
LKSDLKLILTTVVTAALIILPVFAADYPLPDKRTYFRILQEWPVKVDLLIEQLRT